MNLNVFAAVFQMLLHNYMCVLLFFQYDSCKEITFRIFKVFFVVFLADFNS